ncbi:transglycosylase SLT domain-containing protein [Citrobacter sedlakii]|uniref:transglycosylase SLT domain-containing protein n=1 Tax=Citrobacter sedlakii TaxID=67826 RepID=UPI0020C0702C|nr:transglycosylase SLT domain-containing protein [Citrobacter sedlakii]MCK8147069.1 transglycosylase SLT domain-containing protein [Citrobacter sedlakii]
MAGRSILMAVLCCGLTFAGAAKSAPVRQSIPPAYRLIAEQERVPAESLYSLAMAESTRKTAAGAKPWPWTLNVAGKGYHYETREDAWQALLGFMRRYPLKRIDAGIAQVNLGWNGHYFPSFRDAFDPHTNLRAAARILRACYDARPGSWIRAAGCYHHPAGGKPAASYMATVRRKLSQISPEPAFPAERPVSLASNQLTWIEPQ